MVKHVEMEMERAEHYVKCQFGDKPKWWDISLYKPTALNCLIIATGTYFLKPLTGKIRIP